jgi:hypothetical protein
MFKKESIMAAYLSKLPNSTKTKLPSEIAILRVA